jgi:hypothetical protein
VKLDPKQESIWLTIELGEGSERTTTALLAATHCPEIALGGHCYPVEGTIGPDLFWDPGEVFTYIFFGGLLPANPILPLPLQLAPFLPQTLIPGPFFSLSVGLLCLGLTLMRARVMYWCLQVALWLISVSLWMPITMLLNKDGFDVPGSFTPLLLMTLALSLALLAAYKPVIRLLRKLFRVKWKTISCPFLSNNLFLNSPNSVLRYNEACKTYYQAQHT